ncbi:hypothetical protein BGZ76_004717 [Entomortierella beljakovae]|nr:hypothetical protein BGZ76_004717 [Entomortierella beljakovae]
MDQFKWAIISCCNEIKSRVAKQRLELANIPVSLNSENVVAALQISQPQQQAPPPPAAASVPFSQWMFEKSKGSKPNPGPVSQGIESVPNDPRVVLNSLLQIISIPIEEMSQRTTAATNGTTTTKTTTATGQHDPVNGYAHDSTKSSFYHVSPSSQTHNPSLHSLMGSAAGGGGGADANSKRARSINQYPHFSASYQSLTPSVASTAPVSPSPNSSSSTQQQQQQQQPRLRSKKSQSKIARAQATDSVLQPLTIEELVWLLGFTLTVAPEQELWIPWHLYDFFIKPQGFQYKDLVGMLPTDSQWIIRSILETVDQLVEYAVMMAISQQKQQQNKLQPPQQQLHHQKSKSKTNATAAMVAVLGGGGEYNGGNGLRQQLSQAHLRSKSEANVAIGSKQSFESSMANLITALTAPDQASSATENAKMDNNNEIDLSQMEYAAIRSRKRRVILDSLANLVFRSRKVGTSGSEPPMDRESMLARQNLDASTPSEDRSKTKRRYSYAINGANGSSAVSTTSGTSASLIMQARVSEMEREEGLRAFENLVTSFEKENQLKMAAKSFRKPVAVEALVIPAPIDTNVVSNVSGPSSVSLPNSPVHGNNPGFNSANHPRLARSLPSPVASPDAELATTVRSIPSSQRRKTDPLTNVVHLGQDQQNNRSHHNIVESLSEISNSGSLRVSPTSSASEPLVSKYDDLEKVGLEVQDSNSTNDLTIPAQDSTNNMTTATATTTTTTTVMSSVGNEELSLIRPNSEPARQKPKANYITHSYTFSNSTSSPASSSRHQKKVSTVLSATWSAWKDHLLVLEEEEFVIEDGSDVDGQEFVIGSKKSEGGLRVGFLKGNQQINEHNNISDLYDGYSNNNNNRQHQQHIDIYSSFPTGLPPLPPPPATRKPSRTLGDLKQIALALEAGRPEQEGGKR